MDNLIKISGFQSENRSENLTSTLQSFRVEPCNRREIKEFIEKWHYSKSINGLRISHCFKLLNNNEIIGACIFGGIAMANVWKKYAKEEKDLIELRRLCCIDATPKNTESFFISKCLKWLKKNTDIKLVISYADQTYNHTGIIYQASNFKKVGFTSSGRVINHGGRLYHDKTIRTKYKGILKPFAVKVKLALENKEAFYQDTKPKIIYLYKLKD